MKISQEDLLLLEKEMLVDIDGVLARTGSQDQLRRCEGDLPDRFGYSSE